MKRTSLFLAVVVLLCAGLSSCNSDNNYDGTPTPLSWVDLGLPSGLLWASQNLGALSPVDYGDYFAWGETQTKESYSWETYTLCDGTKDVMTKYDGTDGTTLLSEDDAAHANWGGDWRTPTKDELVELLNEENCSSVWTEQNGVYGMLITSVKNGNTLFLPAAGSCDGDSPSHLGEYGTYWLSTINITQGYLDGAYAIDFTSESAPREAYYYGGRYVGLPIRPVRSAQ